MSLSKPVTMMDITRSVQPAFIKTFAIIISLTVLFSSCDKLSQETSGNIQLPAEDAAVIDAGNDFAFSLLHAALQYDNNNGNKLISPLSVYLALSMTYNGAANATRDSMAKALQLHNINIDELNEVCKTLIDQLPQADSKVQLDIANAIWYKEGNLQPLPGFSLAVNRYFNTGLRPLNFKDAGAVDVINSWVAANTQQKIRQVIEGIDSSELMFLVNALYFKGIWKYNFDSKQTFNADFYLQNGQTVAVPFMQQQATLDYTAENSVRMIALPYGSGNFSMYILLPAQGQQMSVEELAASMDKASFNSLLDHMQPLTCNLLLPKWKYAYAIEDMKPVLTSMGMGLAFTNNADFSAMYNVPVAISRVIHKTYIEVNEQGTEAAAVTAVGVAATSVGTGPPTIGIDHPFLYIIREKSSGAILFTGVVNDPSHDD